MRGGNLVLVIKMQVQHPSHTMRLVGSFVFSMTCHCLGLPFMSKLKDPFSMGSGDLSCCWLRKSTHEGSSGPVEVFEMGGT